VPWRRAHLLQVVVLAADAQALLSRHRAPVRADLLASKDVLELHHAGVREEERRIVAGDERTALDHGVPAFAKVGEKPGPDLGTALHADVSLGGYYSRRFYVIGIRVSIRRRLGHSYPGALPGTTPGTAGNDPRCVHAPHNTRHAEPALRAVSCLAAREAAPGTAP